MANWSSSSSQIAGLRLSDREAAILDILKTIPGQHSASDISKRVGSRVEGSALFTLQVKVLESGTGKIRRKRDGRIIWWWFENVG